MRKWRIYAGPSCLASLYRCDVYWHKVLSITDNTGNAKYSALGRLVRLVLSLSHGQADVERGFSLNNATLRNERNSISGETLIALRIVKDELSLHENIESIPMTKSIISSYRNAHSRYQERLKAKREEDKAEVSKSQKRKLDSKYNELDKRKLECV